MLRQRRVKLKKWRLQKTHGRGKSEDTRLHHGRYISMSAEETERLGAAFAHTLRGGEIIILEGELGTGKTTFVRGLARALGIRGAIRSPTFTLLHEYKIRKWSSARHFGRSAKVARRPKINGLGIRKLIHVDAYRLKSAADLRALGLEEYLGKKDTIVVIEWGRKALRLLRLYRQQIITFTHGTLLNERTITYDRSI